MASVTDHDKDRWRISISDKPRYSNRLQIYPLKSAYTKKQVVTKAFELEQKHKSGEIDLWNTDISIVDGKICLREELSTSLTIQEGVEIYLRKAKMTLANSTYTERKRALTCFKNHFGNMYLDVIPNEYLNEYINAPKKLATRNSRRTYLKQMYKAINEKGYNFSVNLRVLSTRQERKENEQVTSEQWINKEELELICEAHLKLCRDNTRTYMLQANLDMVHLFRIGFYTGLRRSDLIALNSKWFDGETLTIGGDYSPKSQKKQEKIALLKEARDLLSENIHLFPLDISPNHLTTRFMKARRLALPEKTEIHLHSLRHSFVMYCLDELHLPERIVKQLTRHEDHRSFQKYTHNSVKNVLKYINEFS